MIPQLIILISYGQFDAYFLSKIAESITNEYHLPVVVEEAHIELADFYDPARRQYDANKLLKEINANAFFESIKRIGLFRVDLFIPILTYIFGQAFLNGKSGVASLYRLRNELYGMEPNNEILLERFKKVIIHELGHTFGLKHCHTPSCVMLSSTYMEDIDQKENSLCLKCRNELKIEQNS